MLPEQIICPNCHKPASGLYSGDHYIQHCGCYYDGTGEVNDINDDFWQTWEYGAAGNLQLIPTVRAGLSS